jgi:hypothetical protein
MRHLWIYYPVAVACLGLALVAWLGPDDSLDALSWLTLGAFLGATPPLLSRAFWLGYRRARLDYWARAHEAKVRGLTVVEFLRAEVDRDVGDT